MKKIIQLLGSVFFIALIMTFYGCSKDYENPINRIATYKMPTLTTSAVFGITLSTAEAGGIIIDDGGNEITARGVCWSTKELPTTLNESTTNGTGSGSFTSYLTHLNPGTTYSVRAYAFNSAGVSYGNQLSFTTRY